MQDLEQGNYIAYEWAHTRRESGQRSFYAYSSLGGERALPRTRYGFYGSRYRHSLLPQFNTRHTWLWQAYSQRYMGENFRDHRQCPLVAHATAQHTYWLTDSVIE